MFEHVSQYGGRVREAVIKFGLTDIARVIEENPHDAEPA